MAKQTTPPSRKVKSKIPGEGGAPPKLRRDDKESKRSGRFKAAVWTIGLSLVASAIWWSGGTTIKSIFASEPVEEFRVVVVGPSADFPDGGLWDDIGRGVKAAELKHSALFSRLNIKVEYFDDEASPDRSREHSEDFAADPSVLAVIGPCQSQVAREALKAYEKNPKLVLLPTVTSPRLPSKKSANPHVYRLPPQDEEQAEDMVRVITDIHERLRESDPEAVKKSLLLNHAHAKPGGQFDTESKMPTVPCTFENEVRDLVILRDEHNHIYSDFLAARVRGDLEDVDKRAAEPRIIVDGRIGPGSRTGVHVTTDLVGFNACMVLYAGYRDIALTLARQSHTLGWRPISLLSDGCVDHRFLKLGGEVVDGAIAFFPYCYQGNDQAMLEDLPWLDQPSYSPFGYDAIDLLCKIIKSLPAGELSPQRVLEKMQEVRHEIDFEGLAGHYESFSEMGKSSLSEFHLWQVRAVDESPGAEYVWQHLQAYCPAEH